MYPQLKMQYNSFEENLLQNISTIQYKNEYRTQKISFCSPRHGAGHDLVDTPWPPCTTRWVRTATWPRSCSIGSPESEWPTPFERLLGEGG